MKKIWKKIAVFALMVCMAFSLAACGGNDEDAVSGGTSSSKNADTSEVANDYYLDLTDLGMKLTVYLRLDAEGNFIFSNTLDFTTNKGSGTFQKSDDAYVMIYDSVNGEEKSISEGITASFVVTEDGNLDFSGSDVVPYGSANINTVAEDDASIKLMGHIVTEDFAAPSTESAFQSGSYTTEMVQENGVYYTHMISFYEDNTYLHFMSYEQDGNMMFASETGTYGVSTSQLALEPEISNAEAGHSGRVECEIVDGSNLVVSVYPYAGATERVSMNFTKVNMVSMLGSFYGSGTVTGSTDTFSAELTIYEDGSYETVAEGFTEEGILVLNSANNSVKQYPNHPETGVKGLSQVTTVPAGAMTSEDSVINIQLRVRTSENLTRYACTVSK